MEESKPNPLFVAQREKVGAETAADYAYQYHWALYRAIQEHGKEKEYAIFVELHEDVILSNSLDVDKARFEFNQVKTTNRIFSIAELCRPKNGNSVLGKLLDTCTKKPFHALISEINLVSLKGFNLKLKNEGITLQRIKISDLDETTITDIAKRIKTELGLEALPVNLQFIVPDLVDKKFQNDVIAEISKLIELLFPSSHFNSVDIYRVLIDELNRKGMVEYDFTEWENLLDKKALTSTTVQRVINQYTNTKDEVNILSEFNKIAQDLGLNVLAQRGLKKDFDRYRQARIGNKSTIQIDITKSIVNAIESKLSISNNDFVILLNEVTNELPDNIRNQFSNETSLHAAIICEYIMSEK